MSLRPFPNLSPVGARLWQYGDGTGDAWGRRAFEGDPPVPGDLWIVSVDQGDFGREDLVLVLLTRVHSADRYVSCVPVTSATEPHDASTVLMTDSVLGAPLVRWPHLDTGVGYEALDRRLGTGLDALTLARLRAWANECADSYTAAVADGATGHYVAPPPPLPLGPRHEPGTMEHEAAENLCAHLCDVMTVACYAFADLSDAI